VSAAVNKFLIVLATVVGAFGVVAQVVDYLATGKLSIRLIGIALIFSAVPIVVIVVIMVRQGKGSIFSWNSFRVVAASSATVATLAMGTTAVITSTGSCGLAISGLVSYGPGMLRSQAVRGVCGVNLNNDVV
jgi:hypothetical protein